MKRVKIAIKKPLITFEEDAPTQHEIDSLHIQVVEVRDLVQQHEEDIMCDHSHIVFETNYKCFEKVPKEFRSIFDSNKSINDALDALF